MTGNKEDYLKIIYELGGDIDIVNNKDIAKALSISAPSVSEMIKKLLHDGYVEYTLYQGVKLTEHGIKEAMKIRRRHLLWEVFLVEKLGYNWDEVHQEAEILEHVTSIELEKRLDKYLNYPKICPHGTPIINDEKEKLTYKSLDSLSVEERGKIQRLADFKEVLRYTKDNGLKIGTNMKIKSIEESSVTIILVEEDKCISIDKEIARNIYVK